MTSSSHKLPIIFSFFLALVSFTTVNGDLIDTVCAKTLRPASCQQTLRSDPRSTTADLKGLGLVSVDIATKQAISGKALAQGLLNVNFDQRVKSAISSCLEKYDDSVFYLGQCSESLRSGNYGGLNFEASSAGNSIGACEDGFADLPKPEPRQLEAANSNLQGVCDIVLVISNLLLKA
ncbi:unnamed protein product [Cuscuta epithymum]|uniref:Pectinesterase inhibitor domain-containing protein n=1 Tax=Cuscuta epithymum TaxID=186058 RepID=A0AAV0F2H5_9ASTE|nr:unnamed protein product [Cuscuta epithymum]